MGVVLLASDGSWDGVCEDSTISISPREETAVRMMMYTERSSGHTNTTSLLGPDFGACVLNSEVFVSQQLSHCGNFRLVTDLLSELWGRS